MRWEVEVNGEKLAAGPVGELTELLGKTAEQIKESGPKCVVDLRRGLEMPNKPTARLKELGVSYAHVPVILETFSEQDMDCGRREFARHWGQVLVISEKGSRAIFFVLSHAARAQGWSYEEALSNCSALSTEKVWLEHLKAYLARHNRTPANA